MFKLVVLSAAVIASVCAAPAPGLLGGYAIPAATSYSSRIDIHKPVVATYAAPIVTKAVVAAPIAYSGYDHGYGLHEPLISGYGVGVGHGYGLEHGYGGLDYGYGGYGGHGW